MMRNPNFRVVKISSLKFRTTVRLFFLALTRSAFHRLLDEIMAFTSSINSGGAFKVNSNFKVKK